MSTDAAFCPGCGAPILPHGARPEDGGAGNRVVLGLFGLVAVVWVAIAFNYRAGTPCGMLETAMRRFALEQMADQDNPFTALGAGIGASMVGGMIDGLTQVECTRAMVRYWRGDLDELGIR